MIRRHGHSQIRNASVNDKTKKNNPSSVIMKIMEKLQHPLIIEK